MKYSKKDTAQRLAYIASQHGIEQIVFSPGSRNAPLVIAFHAIDEMMCRVVPDERAAAFIAMGMSLASNKTTAIACTSGSAAVNYAPAIVEAYHQGIPLLILTADRPEAWIGQGAGQSMNQLDLYRNYIKASYQLPSAPHSQLDLWHIDRMINEAMITCQSGTPGPVHINVPFDEPLYELSDNYDFSEIKIMKQYAAISDAARPSILSDHGLAEAWQSCPRKMIIIGQQAPDSTTCNLLRSLESDPTLAILTECTSNIPSDIGMPCIDRFLMSLHGTEKSDYYPLLVLTAGDAIISKKLRRFLQDAPDCEHWQVTLDTKGKDRYQKLTTVLSGQLSDVLQEISQLASSSSTSRYRQLWYDRHDQLEILHHDYLENLEWCDMSAMHQIFDSLPAAGEVHLANSSPVRYAQLFSQKRDLLFRSNRGVSGIDGSSSTAVGAAIQNPDRIITLLTGDISFFYDSNAFWHDYLPSNLRIVLVNNGGGAIFRIIEGPNRTEQLDEFFVTSHQRDAKHLCAHHQIVYKIASTLGALRSGLQWLYHEADTCALLEINTQNVQSEVHLKNYFKALHAGTQSY